MPMRKGIRSGRLSASKNSFRMLMTSVNRSTFRIHAFISSGITSLSKYISYFVPKDSISEIFPVLAASRS